MPSHPRPASPRNGRPRSVRLDAARLARSALQLRLLTRQRTGMDGAVMAVVLLLAIGVPLAALAAASLMQSGGLRAALLGQSREARDAAESGILAVISDLNRVENRRLLVSDSPRWSASDVNLCALNRSPSTPSTTLTQADFIGKEFNLVTSGERRYKLTKVQILNPDRRNYLVREAGQDAVESGDYNPDAVSVYTSSASTAKQDKVGYIRLTVEGLIYKPGNSTSPAARATVTREFQVVPKCCGYSFGPIVDTTVRETVAGVFGADGRRCPANTGIDGTGIVAFGGGIFKNSGTASTVQGYNADNPALPRPTAVLCVPPVGSTTCSSAEPQLGNTSGGLAPLVNADLNIRPVPEPPPVNLFPPASQSATPVSTAESLPNSKYCVRSTDISASYTHRKYLENPSIDQPVEDAWLCLLPGINLAGSRDIDIYSSANGVTASGPTFPPADQLAVRPVRIWVRGAIQTGGNATISHFFCSELVGGGGGSGCSPVSRAAAFGRPPLEPPKYDDVHFYGNSAPNGTAKWVWNIQGTAEGLSAFIYAPKSECGLGGNGQYLGKVWCYTVGANGTITLFTPPSGTSTSYFDYYARSTWGARLFGPN